jgi:hypothetical protein
MFTKAKQWTAILKTLYSFKLVAQKKGFPLIKMTNKKVHYKFQVFENKAFLYCTALKILKKKLELNSIVP